MAIKERVENYFKRCYEQRAKFPFGNYDEATHKVIWESQETMLAYSYKAYCERQMKHAGKIVWWWEENDGVPYNSEVVKADFCWGTKGYERSYKVGYIRTLIKEYVQTLND